MTREPVRWSDGASDADPVLRAVVRYAQGIEPSRADVAACAAAVAHAESSAARTSPVKRQLRGWSRRTLPLIAAIVAVLVAGAALAMTWVPWRHKPLASITASRRPASPPSTVLRPAAPPEPPATPPITPRDATPPLVTTAPAAAGLPSTEVELLSAARKELRMHPARALRLLATHAERFPSSTFAEERAALRVEALFTLGRTAEAEREYASFNDTFPDSIYRLRLSAKRVRP